MSTGTEFTPEDDDTKRQRETITPPTGDQRSTFFTITHNISNISLPSTVSRPRSVDSGIEDRKMDDPYTTNPLFPDRDLRNLSGSLIRPGSAPSTISPVLEPQDMNIDHSLVHLGEEILFLDDESGPRSLTWKKFLFEYSDLIKLILFCMMLSISAIILGIIMTDDTAPD